MRRSDDHGFPYVRALLRLDEVDSTNDLARRLLDRDGLPARSLIWADRQTRGRGQGANAWWSDPGSLTATVVVDPAEHGLTLAHGPRVALTVASSIVAAVREIYPACRPGIRWPNDVEVGGRKLGGLLAERVETPRGARLVIGVGLNVRTRLENAPADVARMAASLAEWDEVPPSDDPKARLLGEILGRFEGLFRYLASDAVEMRESWARLDTLAGTPVRVAVGAEVIEATAEGIDGLGGLRLRVGDESRVIYSGRVLRD